MKHARPNSIVAPLALCLLCSAAGRAADVELRRTNDELRLSNGKVELALDAHSGYFRRIRNTTAGIQHKPAAEGVWPFGIWLGTRQQPKQKVAEITSDSPQRMRHRFRGSREDGTLEMVYGALVENDSRRGTGVRLEVRVRLRREWDYFVVTATLQNRGRDFVTSFYAGQGVQLIAIRRKCPCTSGARRRERACRTAA